ncbi:MAG TPA: SMP-30/gluconolactonase/LRE family protein [Solirubrobacteraceae bacterium]|nr:SMP-30/gluconolactonase/LRE family protein [Solirubrobacteraceae bacterium]
MSAVTQAKPVRIVEADAHEGPVYVEAEHALYFTTRRPRVDVKRLDLGTLDVTLVRADANVANGMAPFGDGRLLVCEQHPAAVTLLDPATGETEVLADSWNGLPLNSPNDVVRRSDGSVWFTDPSYGFLQGFRPEPEVADSVYRYDPESGALEVAAGSFDKPNGIAFSPDESILYVADNGAPHHIVAFDVLDGRRLGPGRPFALSTPAHPDGLKVDAAGNVYASSAGGIQVLNPAGDRIDEIELPGAVNFTFGGTDRDVLYVTSDDAVWAVQLDTRGAP